MFYKLVIDKRKRNDQFYNNLGLINIIEVTFIVYIRSFYIKI